MLSIARRTAIGAALLMIMPGVVGIRLEVAARPSASMVKTALLGDWKA